MKSETALKDPERRELKDISVEGDVLKCAEISADEISTLAVLGENAVEPMLQETKLDSKRVRLPRCLRVPI